MGPIELLYFTIAAIVMLIGLARGYAKELGSTLIILVALFILTFFQSQIRSVLSTLGRQAFGLSDDTEVAFLQSVVFTIAFVAIVFTSYAGTTLEFSGRPAPPPQGTIFSILIGLLNGYLIAGTLWYFQDEFGYPIQRFVTFDSNLTETARTLIEYLPPKLFDNPVYWIVPVAVLLIIRVRG